MEFTIVKNTLYEMADIKCLALENDFYIVKFYYYGSYEADFNGNQIDFGLLRLVCKSKENDLPLTMYKGDLYVDMSYTSFTYLDIDRIHELKSKLETAQLAIIKLSEYLDEYFKP